MNEKPIDQPRCHRLFAFGAILFALTAEPSRATSVLPNSDLTPYPDGRPVAGYRLEAQDAGPVLRHGDGPGQCDYLGARDVWVWEQGHTYFMHYDGAGTNGWLACLATSKDLRHWTKHGPVLRLGSAGADDSASASYGVTFREGRNWHLFYLGTPHTTPAPDFIPAFPYLTLKARAKSPMGPWTKQPDVIPFHTQPGTYYSATASPGQVIPQRDDFLMFFSASTANPILRTLGIARTHNLNGAWRIDPEPLVPATEQVENTSLYHEPKSDLWWLFTDHVGLRDGLEYTDAIWVYWSADLNHWNPKHKAVVLDARNCGWSRHIIGLPSVVKVGQRLAIFYDGNGAEMMPGGVKSHMNRDVGLAWLDLPLVPPADGGTGVASAVTNVTSAVDLRPAFEKWGLPLRSQSNRGTCSVFTLTGALEYALASRQQTGTVLSVEFLNWAANQARAQAKDGGFFSDLWKGFEAYGICPETSLAYRQEYDARLQPDERALSRAREIAQARLQLHWIKPWDVTTGLTEIQLLEIKRTLSRGWPVCGGFRWPKHESWHQGMLQMAPAGEVFDGHSVLLVGFKEDLAQPGSGAFLIRNSGGGVHDGAMPYEYVRAYMNDAAWIAPEIRSSKSDRRPAAAQAMAGRKKSEARNPHQEFGAGPHSHFAGTAENSFRHSDFWLLSGFGNLDLGFQIDPTPRKGT